MKTSLLILCLLVHGSLQVAAQKSNSQNHLLWRISGKGLARPSYIYGTMHLTDRRLFQFGDSLYSALENTEGFAAELDMSKVVNDYLLMFGGGNTVVELLKDKAEGKLIAKYKTKLEKKFKKPVSQITMSDLDNAGDEAREEAVAKGEMKTFMDAYLFDIAKRQGKWTGGIEDMEDQFGLSNKVDIESRIQNAIADKNNTHKLIEWMINTYIAEDVDAIEKSDQLWNGAKDQVLLNRNIKMVSRMDSLSGVRSCLFAVGAAHLPGDSGVVELLRKKGFMVEPVVSSRKISPESYQFTEVEQHWEQVVMTDSLFTVQMPGTPVSLPIKGLETIDTRMYFDISSNTAYFTFSIPIAAHIRKAKRDSVLDMIGANYKSKLGKDFTERIITISGMPAREWTIPYQGLNMRMIGIAAEGHVCMMGVFSLSRLGGGNDAAPIDAERFFDSYKPGAESKGIFSGNSGDWKIFDIPEQGFSAGFPGGFTKKEIPWNPDETDFKRSSYEASDIATESYYIVAIDEVKRGSYAEPDTTVLSTVREAMQENAISSRYTKVQGFDAIEMELRYKDNPNIFTKMVAINRGNRRYTLVHSYDRTRAKDVDRFFTSFKLLEPVTDPWSTITANGFTAWSPSAFELVPDSMNSSLIRYNAFNGGTVTSFIVEKETFPGLYWARDDTSFLQSKIATYVGYSDSVILKRFTQDKRGAGADLHIKVAGSAYTKKMRLQLTGDTLYTAFAFLPPELEGHPETRKFFTEFTTVNHSKPVKLFEPKTAQLLIELKNEDFASLAKAKELLGEVPFNRSDLPMLQESLLHVYRDFDTVYYFNANANTLLAGLVKTLDSNHTSVEFIRKRYPSLDRKKEELKPILLGILSAQRTAESYDLLRELIVNDPPQLDVDYYFYPEWDSLVLNQRLFPGILSSIHLRGLGSEIADLAVLMLDSNLVTPAMIIDNKQHVFAAVNAVLQLAPQDRDDRSYQSKSFVKLLRAINNAEANAMIRKLAVTSDVELKMECILALLHNKQVVDKKDILIVAKSDTYRHDLYDRLKADNKLAFFPIEYASQRWLGQSILFTTSSDEESPEKMTYLGERIFTFNNEKKKFYLYKVEFVAGEPESSYLGVAGPYSLNPKDFNTAHDATMVYWEENYSAKETDRMFKALMEQAKKFMQDNQ